MATRRTLDFLPSVFQTDTNRKFLSATLDQLVSEPEFVRLNGFIGRKFAPTYKTKDSYVQEANAGRQNYQLEPSVVVKNSSNEIEFYSSYTDLINKIAFYGGATDDHDRLFASEYYAYNPLIDQDKFVNFQQYYWLPNGPTPIEISAEFVTSQHTFTVTNDSVDDCIRIDARDDNNPEIVLSRGGLYKFNVDMPGHKFYIQTEPGVSGTRAVLPSESSRNVYGVTNNGADSGTVEFRVPLTSAQDVYLKMPYLPSVDYAVDISFTELDGALWEDIVANYGGFDGIDILPIERKIILTNFSNTDADWTRANGEVVAAEHRRGVWRVSTTKDGQGRDVIALNYLRDSAQNHRIYVRLGKLWSNSEFYLNSTNLYMQVPPLTAQLDTLYYQDAADPQRFGRIRIVDSALDEINVETAVLGKKNYTTPSGIDFTNGMLVSFDSTIKPAKYANSQFIVEGVGTGIRLVRFDDLVCPEPNVKINTVPLDRSPYGKGTYDEPYRGPADPDYITMNRGSLDLNAWARHNRWFHIDVITKSAELNGTIPVLDQSTIIRAQRPIIEFNGDIQLLNNGRVGKRPVDHIDTTHTNAFNQVQHSATLLTNGVRLQPGQRILFANDKDPLVRSQVYIVGFYIQSEPAYQYIYDGKGTGTITVDPAGSVSIVGNGTKFLSEVEYGAVIYGPGDVVIGTVESVTTDTKIQLNEDALVSLVDSEFYYKNPRIQLSISSDPEDALVEFDTLVAKTGENKGNTFWYNGDRWTKAQLKSNTNQFVKFDVFDSNDTSYAAYAGSNFAGTNIFSYKVGTGANDSVLGFPISYTTNYSIADITFNNDFNIDSFRHLVGNSFTEEKINRGYLRQNTGRYSYAKRNTWTTVNEPSHQYQIISKVYTGKTNYFEIDITGKTEVHMPTIKVFLNNRLLDSSQYQAYVMVKKRNTVKIPASLLNVGDKVDILIYSGSISKIGYYQVPTNLDFNSKNESFNSVTLGQLRNSLTLIGQNISGVVGSIPGESNIRDLDTTGYPGNILQNSAPVIYSSLFLINETTNFVSAIEYARREYTKFKNKFLELCQTLPGLDIANPKTSVDKILLNINGIKNKTFPWYYSDMVPYGEAKVLSYTVLDTTQRDYKINSIFDDTVLQSRAVLVYLNNRQLVKDVDYFFNKTKPGITLSDSIVTLHGDRVEIRDYATTDGNFIPETPTKLGLYPKFIPEMYFDDTYREPVNVIRGHDGSLTPAFNDFRDQFLIELETRIYNNIKQNADANILDIRTLVPGRFRDTGYTITEYNRILNKNFLKWAGAGKINYTTNSYFQNSDPFTYNYSETKDPRTGNFLPGYWRGIYQYYYDTDKPHTHPWEMLGFANQPIWWEAEYGPAPYTSDNTVLWQDLEQGMIRQGNRAGIDERYARPGLSSILPVDSSGDLVSPMERIATPLNTQTVEKSFAIGDVGPAEAAWRRTSEFPYSLQIAAALMKPAVYFGTLLDTSRYFKDSALGQYILSQTNNRVTPTNIVINGESVNGAVTRASGYINWIVDYATSLGIAGPAKVRSSLDNLEVQLSYKMAGYTDKKLLSVLAEQYSPSSVNDSVIIPDENYQIYLNKSVPVEKVAYSAVIVERTDTGYAVSGYNQNNPYFVIIPSETTGDKYTIDVDGVTAVVYQSFKKQKLTIPYGTEFANRQQVVDFLVSYQRALIAQGFVFVDYDSDLGQLKDWVLSAKEFITWTRQGWKAGNILVLSPISNVINLATTDSVVDKIDNTPTGGKLLDPNFAAIKSSEFTVLRDNGDFKLTTISGKSIAFAELNFVQYEHVLVFDNKTIFNDFIYSPASGSRQYRLKLVGTKTDNWDGSLSPNGFVYNSDNIPAWKSGKDYLKGDIVVYKNQYYTATQKVTASTTFDFGQWKQIEKSDIKTGLLSNLANNAGKFVNIYDVDSSLLDSQMARMSSGLIGFRERSYLTDLNVDHTSQTKFYQGYIKDKGTGRAVTNLLNATFNDLSNDVTFNEEWAFRVGEYGALRSNSVVEIILKETTSANNPIGLAIVDNASVAEDGIVTVKDRDLWDRSFGVDPVRFVNRPLNYIAETDIQSAGYVNLDDIDATLFDTNDYKNLNADITNVVSGYVVYVAKDHNKDWNVYRATETDTTVSKFEYSLDNVAKVTTVNPHGLQKNQLIVIKTLDSKFDSYYVINEVTDLREFTITVSNDQAKMLKEKGIVGNGLLFVMNSIRFASPNDIDSFTPSHGWRDGDLVWVDHNVDDRWSVYKKDNSWYYKETLDIQLGSTRPHINYGASVKLANKHVVVGAPGDQDGYGRIHVFNRETLKEIGVVASGVLGTQALGKCVDFAGKFIVAGAPDTDNGQGAVVVFRYQSNTAFIPSQYITSPEVIMGAEFGYAVSQSSDGEWLYVGAPGANQVHAYKLKHYENAYNAYSAGSIGDGCTVPYIIDDIDSLAVYFGTTLLKPGLDYTISQDQRTVHFERKVSEIVTESGEHIAMENGFAGLITEFDFNQNDFVKIQRRSYYQFKATITNGEQLDQFGYSVKTSANGDYLVVGAPGAAKNDIVQAGRVYGYANSLANESAIELAYEFEAVTPVYRANFGQSVDYAYDSKAVYIGAPGYSTFDYTGGLVQRFEYVNGSYVLAQELFKPVHLYGENFGSYLKVSANDRVLAVSSTHGTNRTTASYDTEKTTFDSGATTILDITPGTGAVYLHEYMPAGTTAQNPYGNFVFGTEFAAPQLHRGDQFGCGIDFDRDTLLVGAAYNDVKGNDSGAVYVEKNDAGKPIWSITRQQKLSVDHTTINNVGLYNKLTKSKIANLDYINPAKGKVLGIAEQNLDFKTSRDPAVYNAGTSVVSGNQIDFHWGAQQVGQVWWNLDTVRFIDYEQETLVYRMNNWGKFFPGSTVSVYEWIESELLPSEYVAAQNEGTPLHADDSYYVQVSYADAASGIIKTKYYYWVKGITSAAGGTNKTLSVKGIENAIANPKAQGIPYAAILADNSLALFNCDKYVSGNNTILKVDYDNVPNNNVIHSEFSLIKEGSSDAVIPDKLFSKLVDSLAGADALLRRVPDPKLRPSQSLGLEVRPRQTLIQDRWTALKNLVEFANSVLAGTTSAYKLQNSEKFESALWFAAEPEPTASEYQHLAANLVELGYVQRIAGERILVQNDADHSGLWVLYEVQDDLTLKIVKNQSYKTTDLWTYDTWYKEGFDSGTDPDYIVEYYKDIERLNILPGNVVKVENSATAGFEIYKFNTSSDAELVAVENGILKMSDDIWDTSVNGIGFDNQGFGGIPYDRDRAQEVRNLVIGLADDIFVDDLVAGYNNLIFAVIRYIYAEQQNIDWLFKTSFISVLHKIKQLEQYPNYIKDNHTYYEDYINEVKPYRTKVREYKVGYTGMDNAYAAVSDFDLPGYFDQDLQRFRSPSGEIPNKDGVLYTQDSYVDWAKNFTKSVESITVTNGGYGYTGQVVVRILANGDGGRGAIAEAILDEVTGAVESIHVIEPGVGYINTPHVVIQGNGNGATGYAVLTNKKIRSIKTVMKFDRISYSTDVREWKPNVSYTINDIVSYHGVGYRAIANSNSAVFNPGDFSVIASGDYNNANDRVAATYYPGPNQIQKDVGEDGTIDLQRLVPGIVYQDHAMQDQTDVYRETAVKGPEAYDRETGFNTPDIRVQGGQFFDITKSYAPEELVPGVTLDSVNILVSTLLNDDTQVDYRIIQDISGNQLYLAVNPAGSTTLARDLHYDDTEIYLTDISVINEPNPSRKIPGYVYINGERIKFWEFDSFNQVIKNPIRGYECTGIPVVHPAGTVVEDQSMSYKVPNTTTVSTDRFVFTKQSPIFVPSFSVNSDLSITINKLEVFNGATQLEYGRDYTLDINGNTVAIEFTRANSIADGVRFSARYARDLIWLNSGVGTVTDGTGLAGSQTPAAEFVKQYAHNYP